MSELPQDAETGRLTQAELGIWLGHQRAAAPAIYNAAEGTILTGALNVAAFEDALARTLEEARALHASFEEREGQPVRVSKPRATLLAQVDLSHHPEPRQALAAEVARELQRPFAIERGELYQHYLYRLAPETHVWVHRAHHVALDGYGFSLIARRVAERYGAAQAGRALTAAFDEVRRVEEEDVAYQASEAREQDRRYWLEELRGAPELPSSGGAPTHGWRSARLLTDTELGKLRELAKAVGVEWTELCLALVARLVHQITGQNRFALGLPVMLRFGTAALKVPCMAMNIVPLPVRIAAGRTFAELAADVRGALTRGRPHLRYRYEHLSADPELSRRPFGAVVNLIPFEPPRRFGACEAEPLGISAGPVEDLAFTFRQRRGALELIVEGHPLGYTAERVTELRERLLASLLELSPATPLDTARSRPESLRSRIARQARTRPDATALVAGDQSFSYAELHAAARGGAALLREQGVEPGRLVAIDAPRGAIGVLAALAVLYAGAGYAALDPHHPPARREAMLRLLEPCLVLRAAGVVAAAFDGAPVLELHDRDLEYWQRETGEDGAEPAASEPAYVVFTSGSTGEPKGVVIGHGALDHFVAAALPTYDFHPEDRVLQFAALTFDASVEELAVTWAAGASLVLRDEAMLDSLPAFTTACERLSITVWDLPTAFWHELCLALAEGTVALPRALRLVIVGGEAVAGERLRQWQATSNAPRLLNTYGPSEATIVATCADLSAEDSSRPIAIGRALPGVSALLVDDSRQVIEQSGIVGELCLLGPTLAQGYLRRPDLTGQRFVQLPRRGRAYLTGDLAQLGEDGQLYYVGRRDDELKISGHRVAPAEVEAALAKHPALRASVVYGVRAETGAVHLTAHVEATRGSVTAPDLRRFLGEILPAAMIPTVFELHEELPRTSHGKLDRAALRATAPVSKSALESPELALVAAVWQEVLGASPAADDDFFALGGTSLQVIQLANRLSRRGATLSVASIFRHPTPRAQAGLLSGARQVTTQELVPIALGAWSAAPSARHSIERVLLTGATGFVGSYVLRHLLLHTSCDVVVLARGLESDKRLAETSLTHDLRLSDHGSRVRVVTALADASPCDAIVNAAAEVSLTRDYRSLLDSNVRLVRDLLDVAAAWHASFHQVSTIAAIPNQPGTGPIPETFAPGAAGLDDGYRLSKWQAEQLCQQAAERGLPVAVYRLGRVAAATERPRINARDIVWRIAAASARAGAWPDLAVSEPWIPVDLVARSVVDLMLRGGAAAPARAFHLVHTGTVALEQLRVALSLPRIGLGEWLQSLRQSGSSEDAATAAFFELREGAPSLEATSVRGWSCEQVLRLLPELANHRVDEQLLREHVQAAIAQGVVAAR